MLKPFADWLVFSMMGLISGSSAGESLNFFIYDTLKIFLVEDIPSIGMMSIPALVIDGLVKFSGKVPL